MRRSPTRLRPPSADYGSVASPFYRAVAFGEADPLCSKLQSILAKANEREKYKAEIQARLLRLGETLHEIKVTQEKRKENPPNIHMQPLFQKQEEANARLVELEKPDESSWERFKGEMDNLVNDIDEGIRKALAYFG